MFVPRMSVSSPAEGLDHAVIDANLATMNDIVNSPFTRAEMEAMRRSAAEEESVFGEFRDVFRRLFRRIPFSEDLATAYYCATDPSTNPRVRMVLAGALAYFVLPVDAIADFLPILGFTDDAAVLATAIATVRSAILPKHRERARTALADIETL
jgi:uncharacterized membrane protein YkvA (DUF1232 family)